ncbi:odorant receptor 4-like isoform X4 [Temnothorax longispinosus]
MDYMVDWMSAVLIVSGSLSNLYTRIIHVDKFRELFERMSKDWALQKTHDEAKIMHEHAKTSRLFTLCYLSLSYIILAIYITWMLTPDVLDIISPMNESRPRRQPIDIQFFVNEEYLYIVRYHTCFLLIIIPFIYVGCSTLFVTVTQHVCGMCKLMGNRAERIFFVAENDTAYDLIQESQSYGNLAVFVRQHDNVIQFVDIIETCHTVPFLMELTGMVFLMSLTLIEVLTISSNNFERTFRSVSVAIIGQSYIFMYCYMGQRVTDVSSSICEKIFNSTWYDAVVTKQKALLMIMMRRYHPLILTACKLYVMSLQNFGMTLQTAISYCMFIRQI